MTEPLFAACWRSRCCWTVVPGAGREVERHDPTTLRDWVHRYNDLDVAGLRSRTGPGRPPRLTPAIMEEFREIVATGPDPERHLVVRWRCADLREELAARFSVTVCEQTVGRWLRRLGMTRLQPRPVHPKKDPEAETDFKKTSPHP